MKVDHAVEWRLAMIRIGVLAGLLLGVIACLPRSNIVWQRRYDSGQEDFARALAVDGSDVVVGGYWRDTTDEVVTIDWQILRYDAAGNLLWRRSYDSGDQDWLNDLAIDARHNILAVGFATSDSSDTIRLLLAKFSAQGELLWDQYYTHGLVCQGQVLGITPTNEILVGGATFTGDSNANMDIWLASFDSTGSLVWQETLDFGADEVVQDLSRDGAGNILLVGNQLPDPQSTDSIVTADLLLVKLNHQGRVIWRRVYDSGEDELYGCVQVDDSGKSYVAVTSRDDDQMGMRLLRYDSAGTIIWDRSYVVHPNTVCNALLRATGGVIGVGGAGPDETQRYLVFRFGRNWFSNLLNPRAYNHGTNDLAYDIARDPQGNLIVTGVSDPNSDPDILTIKLRSPGSEK